MSSRRQKRDRRAETPRARSGHNRQRQRLIDACISALHIYGPSRTTVEKVVAIAKMSPGIVRFYFDSKAAMLVASLQFLSAEFEDQLLVPVSKLESNPVAALELMVDLYLDPEIASPRKVSVWYAFWGEASSRQEYYDICGQKDEGFAVLVRKLIGRMIEDTGHSHLDSDGVALGLIGVLEILWQDFAFRSEEDIDRTAAKRRCMAYLNSVFPGKFGAEVPVVGSAKRGAASRFAGWAYGGEQAFLLERDALFRPSWQIAAHESGLDRAGDFVASDLGFERVLLMRDSFGAVQAFRNSCPHVPHTLVSARRGRLERGLECAVHGLRFTDEGESAAGDGDLARLDVRAAEGFYWVRALAPVHEAAAGCEIGEATGSLERSGSPPRLLGELPELEIRANWKLLTEQWLDLLAGLGTSLDAGFGASMGGDPVHGTVSIGGSIAPLNAKRGWSAARYRSLAGAAAGEPWRVRFAPPNQWIEERPDGLSILQIIAAGPARCRVRRMDLGRIGPADALRYLAGRLLPLCRASTLAVAESSQQGLTELGYRAGGARTSPAVARFREYVISRIPALGAARPASELR